MKLVRALFDYTAATREELSFREGDVITVVKEGAEWCVSSLPFPPRPINQRRQQVGG